MAQRENVVELIDWPALWTELDRVRDTVVGLTMERLWKLSTPNDEVSKQTFVNYLSGKTSPPMGEGIPLYQRAAKIVNDFLQKEDRDPAVPFLGLFPPTNGGNELRGRDSNPQPSD